MKLGTMIQARRDGTLSVYSLSGGVKYEFERGPDGDMIGDVRDEKTVTHLLNGGNFYPVNDKDVAKANEMLAKLAAEEAAAAGGSPAANAAGVDADGFDLVDPNAPPVELEAATATPKGKAKAKA
jgi:hypothetical protein